MSKNGIDFKNLDLDTIRELELDGEINNTKFQKVSKRKKFDDGTTSTKTGRKKEKVQRGGKDELPEEDDSE